MNELWLVVNSLNSCSFMPNEFPAMQGAHVSISGAAMQ
jgi:hypothetical protein